ncbi:MAG: DUF120 domain-containing protein [Nitrososphaerales archaeon]
MHGAGVKQSKIKPALIPALIELLMLGAKDEPVKISTTEIAKRIGRSQQSASNHLLELEREGYVERIRVKGGYGIRLSEKGVQALAEIYHKLKQALETLPESITLKGRVFTGIGEGAYYVSLKGYRKQFLAKLGFDPYPGTLNIRLSTTLDRRLRRELEHYRGIRIHEFEDGQRTFGGARCFRAVLNDMVEGAVLAIDRTHYDDTVVEFIAPVNVRERLGLKDGAEVSLNIRLTEDDSNH